MIDVVINGQSAGVRNLREIGFKADFSGDYLTQELNVDSLILVGNSLAIINEWKDSYGFHVGIPTRIVYNLVSYDYYIDLTQNPKFSDDEIEVKIMKRKGLDSFFNVAQGLSFELLNSKGVQFPVFNVPYVIIKDNQIEVGISLSFALFGMAQTFAQVVKDFAYLAAETVAGAAGLSVAMTLAAIAKLALQLTYIVALFLAIKKMLTELKELIFPKIRYLKACSIKALLVLACANIGYGFSSTLLDSVEGLTYLPIPLQKTNPSVFKFAQNELDQSFTKGYPTAGDTTRTLGELLEATKTLLNGKIKIINGVVNLEKREFFSENATFTVVPALNVQEKRVNEYTVNTDDAKIRAYISYQTDYNDMHTLDNFEPTDAEYGFQNVNQLDADLNLIKGLQDITLPFALGNRKNEYTKLEKGILALFTLIDSEVGTNMASTIENRIGVLQVSQQFYGVSKLLICDANGKQPVNYLTKIRASAIWNNYYANDTIQFRGFKRYENAPVLMNFAEYEQILNSNYANVDGVTCEILDLLHLPDSSKAIITYLEPYNFAQGKISTFAINE